MKQAIKLFVFRHGQTDWNVQQRFQGHLDIPLNSTGRTQAKILANSLKNHPIEAILSSDLSRALETAKIVANDLQVPVFQDPGLREAFLGQAQGLTHEEIQKKFGVELQSRWHSSDWTDADVSYPDGETGNQIMTRVFNTIEKFLKENKFSHIGIATHGGVIRRMMQKILPENSPPVPIPNTVLYQIHYAQSKSEFYLHTENR